jgi:hypothetical protein
VIATLFIAQVIASPTLSIRVDGEGYFRFQKGTTVAYARQVKLEVKNGALCASDGSVMLPQVLVPEQCEALTCSIDGRIMGSIFGRQKQFGSIVLAMFTTTPSFKPAGVLSLTSARATVSNPGDGLAGVIRPIVKATAVETPLPSRKPQPITPQSTVAPQSFAVATKSEIKVNSNTLIESEYFNLGDIASISGDVPLIEKLKKVEIGRAPVIGTKKTLSTMLVRALIASNGIDIRTVNLTVPTGASVERKGQKIQPEDISAAVTEAFKKKFGIESQLEPKSKIDSILVAPGKVGIEVANPQMNPNDISVTVDVTVDGKLANSMHLRYDISQLPQVKKGESVRLRIQSNLARIEVNAKTKNTAFLGQSVTVETESGTTHTGKLIGPGLVEVNL